MKSGGGAGEWSPNSPLPYTFGKYTSVFKSKPTTTGAYAGRANGFAKEMSVAIKI